MRLMLDAPIVEVTAYPDRALVVRRGSVNVTEAGTHDIVLSGLPQPMARESLRASGRGNARAQLLGVDLSMAYLAQTPDDAVRELEGAIDRLDHELEANDQRNQAIEQQRGWINTLGEQSARALAFGLIRGTAKEDDPTRIFALARAEGERLIGESVEIARKRQRIARDRDALQRELDSAHAAAPDRFAATIRVLAEDAGTLEFDVSYLVFSASWSPRYDARVDTTSGKVRFSQQAQVRQWSGEDWNGVRLAISTARPSAAVSLPDEVPVWYLEQRLPPPAPYAPMRRMAAASSAPTGPLEAPAFAMMAPRTAEETYSNLQTPPADVESAGTAQIFRINGGCDIPSDGQPHIVTLGDDDLPSRLEYVVAPVVAPGAHLRAVTLNATGHALPRGALHIFHSGTAGDEYVGETVLEATAEGAPLKLYLGVNDNMTIKRELVELDTDRANLLQAGARRSTVAYRLTVSNGTGAEQRVVAMDRAPVSKHERIKVKSLEMRPTPTSQSKLDQLTWEFQLKPGEEKRIEWRFLVESPADFDVSGMP
ncbi:MAG TPA: mucoidy inhibitor MuiA family protein [Ktedonobacterales bacterium]